MFRGKSVRVQGLITKIGAGKMKQAKAEIAKLTAWDITQVSDADAIEFLARGKKESIDYWKAQGVIE